MYNKLQKDWAKAKQLLAATPEPYVPTQRAVRLTKATKKLLRLSLKYHKRLMREKQTRDRLEWYLTRKELLAEVKLISKEKLQPHRRLRERYLPVQIFAPRPAFKVNGVPTLAPVGYFTWGFRQVMVDYKPTLDTSIGKRLNPMNASKGWSNSLSTGIVFKGPKVIGSFPKGKWALNARYLNPIHTDYVNPIAFNYNVAGYALQKAYAKVKEPDLALNEYIFEYRQVINLLKDPFRTLKRFQGLFQRWIDQDAWMYEAPVRVRRFGKGQVVSIASPGQTLMSFRTRKKIQVSTVSSHAIQAAANRWLQWRYGIMPLWQDILAIIGGLAEKPLSNEWMVGTAKHWISRSKTSSQGSIKWGFCTHTYTSTVNKGEFYSAGVCYRLRKKLPFSYRTGLHPSQLIRALWNGVRLSFVVDWFLNVDQWLLAGINTPDLEIGPNYVSAKSYHNVTSTLIKVFVPGYESEPAFMSSPGIYRAGFEQINRHVNLPWKNELCFSTAWTKMKNLVTAEALLVTELFKKQRKV